MVQKMTMQQVIQYLCGQLGATSYELVENSEELARHVCQDGDRIWLLPLQTTTICKGFVCDKYGQGGYITVNVEYYICRQCGKLIVNKNTLN